MDLSFLSKMGLIIKYFFSSFLGIEMFLLGILIFLFCLFTMKKKSETLMILIPIFLVGILIFISGGFHTYVIESLRAFIKYIMNYYYFPALSFYYIMSVIVVFLIIYTVLSEKLTVTKKYINYVMLSIYFVLFLGNMSYIIGGGKELTLDYQIYQDNLVLSFVQISNFLFLLWIIVTCFYYLYLYFRKKYD